MDQEVLVANLKKLAEKLHKSRGRVALLMLLAPDVESEDAWNVIVSAKGFDNRSRANAVRQFTKLLRENVNKNSWHRIARATVLKTDDPFVRAINRAFGASGPVSNIQSCNISGVEIPKAILFQSKRKVA